MHRKLVKTIHLTADQRRKLLALDAAQESLMVLQSKVSEAQAGSVADVQRALNMFHATVWNPIAKKHGLNALPAGQQVVLVYGYNGASPNMWIEIAGEGEACIY